MKEKETPLILPISAVVVGRNEGHLLPNCLDSLDFCKEKIYIDLESSDNSVAIARAHGAIVLSHAPVEIGEMVAQFGVDHASQKWILFLDPDERVMPELIPDLVARMRDDVALISVPCLFHVGGRALRGTVWGSRARPLLMHRDRAIRRPVVHGGYDIQAPYKIETTHRKDKNYVEHLWLSGVKDFVPKHRRYAALEGPKRYERSERASWKSFLYRPLAAFWECFVTKKGYVDGSLGLEMSLLYGWYTFECYRSLWKYQQNRV